jgi:hypothetical protein
MVRSNWPLAAVSPNYTLVDRSAEAAAVKAMASGSQHKTMSAMSHRIALSESVSAPTSSATYLIGALSVSICRPLAPRAARSDLRLARTMPSRRRWSCPELGVSRGVRHQCSSSALLTEAVALAYG